MMFKLTWRNWGWLWHVYAGSDSQGIINILFKKDWWFWCLLFQICWSTSVPKIIKIELSLKKLLQKNKMVQFFLTHCVYRGSIFYPETVSSVRSCLLDAILLLYYTGLAVLMYWPVVEVGIKIMQRNVEFMNRSLLHQVVDDGARFVCRHFIQPPTKPQTFTVANAPSPQNTIESTHTTAYLCETAND